MKFFVPGHENDYEEGERVYQTIKKHVMAKSGKELWNTRISSLSYHDSEDYDREMTVEVGKPSEETGEVVVAIFRSDNVFIVCGNSVQISNVFPMLIGKHEIIGNPIYFT